MLTVLTVLTGCTPGDLEPCAASPRSPAEIQDRYFACMLELEVLRYPDTDGAEWEPYCLERARCW